MSNQYYECHITMIGDADIIKNDVIKVGWKFSKIDGDPILGEGIKCYATKHFPVKMNPEEVVKNVNGITDTLRIKGYKVLRDKVELVIYDSKLVQI